MAESTKASPRPPARVAVIGCGWWAQGWHLPHLAANAPHVEIAAIVDPTPTPISTLSSSPLLSLPKLSEKYNCPYFTSVSELLGSDVGPTLDGAVVATSHASHFSVGMALLNEGMRRRQMAEEGGEHRAVNILMEKPLATEVDEARKLWEASAQKYPEGKRSSCCMICSTSGCFLTPLIPAYCISTILSDCNIHYCWAA